jgi:hypothetical protein
MQGGPQIHRRRTGFPDGPQGWPDPSRRGIELRGQHQTEGGGAANGGRAADLHLADRADDLLDRIVRRPDLFLGQPPLVENHHPALSPEHGGKHVGMAGGTLPGGERER